MDLISNFISMVKTAQRARKESLTAPFSKMTRSILEILKKGGYISDYEESGEKVKKLKVALKYNEAGSPVIRDMKRVSKSSRRVYKASAEIPRIANGYATVIVSTPKGIMTGKEATATKQGGEVICYVM